MNEMKITKQEAITEPANGESPPETVEEITGAPPAHEHQARDLRKARNARQHANQKILDEIYDNLYPTLDSENVKEFKAVGKICRLMDLLPTSALLSEGLERDEQEGRCRLSQDTLRGMLQGVPVVIKTIYSPEWSKSLEVLWDRIPLWKKLHHKNIITFHGADVTAPEWPSLVYDWAEKGNIIEYIALNPKAHKLRLLLEVAEGLEYLHGLDIPHGRLRVTNVVIDNEDHARLTDYGLEPVYSVSGSVVFAHIETSGEVEWRAPELLAGDSMAVGWHKPADVFAFGILAVEVLTGEVPFEGMSERRVISSILGGEMPKVPENAAGNLITECWRKDFLRRPEIEEVVKRLKEWVTEGLPTSSQDPTTHQQIVESREKSRSFLMRSYHGVITRCMALQGRSSSAKRKVDNKL